MLRRHGVLGMLRMAAVYAKDRMLEWKPKRRRALRQEWEFDRRFGVETARVVPVSAMNLDQTSAESAHRYQATPIPAFREMMEALKIEFEQWTFIDVGCGKARTLLMAAEYPFREIVGIELAAELCTQAQRNIAAYRNPAQQCRRMDVVQHDAATYQFPSVPLVVYLYNPFARDVMEKVLDNLQRSLEAAPRPLSVVYYNPILHDLFDRREFLTPVTQVAAYCIYRANT